MNYPTDYPERIPYDSRINSQLSVAKYYWGIIIQWISYVLDYDNCKKEVRDWEEFYYPDLITKELFDKQVKEAKKQKIKKLPKNLTTE